MPPVRSLSRLSMLSAPAHMPATIVIALPAGLASSLTPSLTCCDIRSGSACRSASRTSLAAARRFAPENDAETAPAA
jgi:hypothetical protein